jgi:hypothetical protein
VVLEEISDLHGGGSLGWLKAEVFG